ncbi:MAG: phosphate regulon sensor histidine kinase PhoR, partial [Burkholderiales bacterium]
MKFWLSPLLRLGAVCVFGLIGAAIGGAAVGFAIASVGFLALVLVQLRYLDHLRRWIRAPKIEEIPEGWGAWGDVFGELYRAHRREEKSLAELGLALERFTRAAQALPDAVIILDTDNHIEWANATAEYQLGFDLARDRGRIITDLVRYPELSGYLAADVASAESLLLHTSAPHALTLSVQAVRFAPHEKVLICRDITKLARTDAIRRDFIANVSHELRTPLTVINGYLEHMTEGSLAESRLARPLTLMQEQAARMTRLIEDLLTLSRLEANDSLASEELVDIEPLIAGLLEEGRTLSKGAHVIQAEIAPGMLKGAADELRSAFSNLISNAIRYTPAGGRISLRWSVQELGVNQGGARFSVTDSGVGIAPEHIPRLTERFYRVDRSRSRETGGTGLGLAIVKHVLARHQATLEVESKLGGGSTFHCAFPRARVVAANQT